MCMTIWHFLCKHPAGMTGMPVNALKWGSTPSLPSLHSATLGPPSSGWLQLQGASQVPASACLSLCTDSHSAPSVGGPVQVSFVPTTVSQTARGALTEEGPSSFQMPLMVPFVLPPPANPEPSAQLSEHLQLCPLLHTALARPLHRLGSLISPGPELPGGPTSATPRAPPRKITLVLLLLLLSSLQYTARLPHKTRPVLLCRNWHGMALLTPVPSGGAWLPSTIV